MKRVFLLCGLVTWLSLTASAIAQNTVPSVGTTPAPITLTIGDAPGSLDLATVFTVPGVTGQVVQYDTVLGRFNVELLASAAPNHVANFLTYVNAGDYTGTIFHRIASFEGSIAGTSILQGGGFKAESGLPGITARPPVNLEYNLPNARGTLAAARTNEVNSATSEWYFNTLDNSTILGAANNSGYSVFGRVIGTGMTVVDTIAANPSFNLGGVFTDIPLRDVASGQTNLFLSNLIAVNSISVVPLFPTSAGQTAVISFTVASDHPSIATATLLNGHTLSVTPIAAGSTTLTLTATDTNGNQTQTTVAVSVAEDPTVLGPTQHQTISFAPLPARTVGNSPFTVSATASSGLSPTFTIVSGPATITGSSVTLTGTGTVVVRASQSGDSTFLAASDVDQSFIVTNPTKTQTIRFLAPRVTLANAAPFDLSATATSNLPVSFEVVSGPATLGANGKTLTLTGAGTIVVKATQAGDGTYLPANAVQVSFTVSQATQRITFRPPARLVLSTTPITLSGTSSSGLPVSYAVESGPATLAADGTTLTLTGAGTVVINATQAGNAFVKAATPVRATLLVSQTTQRITFRAPTAAQLAGDVIPLTATSSSGLPVSFEIVSGAATLNPDGQSFVLTGGGSIVIKATQPGDFLYAAARPVQVTVRILQSIQRITFNAPASAMLGNSPITLSASSNLNLPVTLSVVSGNATLGEDNRTLTLNGLGTVTLTATQPGNIRAKAATAVTKTITINLAPATLATGNGVVIFTTLDGDREAHGFKILGSTLLQDVKDGVPSLDGVTTTHPKLTYTYRRLSATTAQFVITDSYVDVSTVDGHERRETGTATITATITFTGLNVNGDTEGTVTLTGTSRGTLTTFDTALNKVVSKPVTGTISTTGTCVLVNDAADLLDYVDAFHTAP